MKILSALARGHAAPETSAVKDDWATLKGYFPDDAYRDHAARQDRRDEYAIKLASRWKWTATGTFVLLVGAFAWGAYGSMRPSVETRFVLVDKRSGDTTEVEAAGSVTPPDVMMARELRWMIGRCGLGAGFDKVDEANCDQYRKRMFLGNSEGVVNGWRRRAEQNNEKLRIVDLISRKEGGGHMAWDARYNISAWDGPNLLRNYRVAVSVKFEYRQPKLGLFSDDDAGLFVREIVIDEERA